MRISEGIVSGVRVDQRHEVNPAHTPALAGRSASVAPNHVSDYTNASEFVQLVARVDETEDVRPEVIAEVSGRLAAGLYDTPAAVEKAAEGILQAEI